MALKVAKVDVWTGTIEDRPGGAAATLQALAQAGASLEMVLARRAPEQPGKGVLFVSPVKTGKAVRAAQAAGLGKPLGIHSLRIEGGDKAGLGAAICQALAAAGISFRGLTAIALGKKFVSYVACDTEEDAVRAVRVLRKL
jgi:hypothetical protein